MSATVTSIGSPRQSSGHRPGRSAVGSPTVEQKWSARRTLAFVVVVCGAFWLSVAAGAVWVANAVLG